LVYDRQPLVQADVTALPLDEPCEQVAALAVGRLEAAIPHHDRCSV